MQIRLGAGRSQVQILSPRLSERPHWGCRTKGRREATFVVSVGGGNQAPATSAVAQAGEKQCASIGVSSGRVVTTGPLPVGKQYSNVQL